MLNYLWAGMILIGIIYGTFTGNMDALGNGALDSAKEAVSLAITLLGVVSMWTGLMRIAEKSGLISGATKVLSPFINFMFPEIPAGHKAKEYITTNIIANIFGLGWAATPAGLKAMEEMSTLNNSKIASNSMCTFLVLNISSLQLIPVNMIAYRTQYGSTNPTLIVAPAIIATIFSTIVAIIYCKLKTSGRNRKKMLI
ncbi:MAG: nucleoside recognition protein [Lachnospiraceae bacterium]|nr:nucleoside recognition protein [Lachnospiraceae bacterium]